MPSDVRTGLALQALRAPRERFMSAVVAAVEEVRAFLEAHRPSYDGRATSRAATELGAFGAGRIDPERFGALLGGGPALDAAALARVQRALHELSRVAAAGDALFLADVEAHADLHLAVGHALASAGRAFGAAQAVERIRAGRATAADSLPLEPFPFRRWNRAERQIAPPLVVEIAGSAVHAGALAEFMDGAQKIILIVQPPAPPAALARLVTPGVLVMQTTEPKELEEAGRFGGPAVAALVPEGAACFVHRPAAGRAPGERLTASFVPDESEIRPLDGMSAFHQREELALLRELAAARPAAPAAGPAASATIDTAAPPGPLPPHPAREEVENGAPGADVDRLAAWLLEQAELG
jgi:hypothetical protein